MEQTKTITRTWGSAIGVLTTFAIGFVLFFFVLSLNKTGVFMPLNTMVNEANTSYLQRFYWLLHDITEPQFYGGVFPSLGLLLGAILSWRLDINAKSKDLTEICYGRPHLFPWVLSSQLLSLFLAIFIFNYTQPLGGAVTFVPTFITVASVPPAVMFLYGPSIPALLTGSLLGGLLASPTAMLLTKVTSSFGLPGVIANVLTMAVTGIAVYSAALYLPWMKKVPVPPVKNALPQKTTAEKLHDVTTPSWLIKRVLADFSEAQFYGTELAGICTIAGLILGIMFTNHIADGTPLNLIAGLLLSQFIGSGTGVFLYAKLYATDGWAPTYIPVVSVGPACVLIFGANLSIPGIIFIAVMAGLIGGVIGVPIAKYLIGKLPEGIHLTVGCVLAMAVATFLTYGVLDVLLVALKVI